MTVQQSIDQAKTEAFVGKVLTDVDQHSRNGDGEYR